MLGTTLNHRYDIEDQIGQGGMGTVYRAEDILLGRKVAVKLLASETLGPEGRDRLLHEARAVARLNHPNIVSVFDAGISDDAPYVVMEFLEGENLADNPPRGIEAIVDTGRQLCEALDHAHQKGIIHRDIKPANALRTPDGTVKLMDFGIARTEGSNLTADGTFLGTVHYIAPEQARGGKIDERTDLYALGVMLYELATGTLPFVGDSAVAVLTQHLETPVEPPKSHNPDIPDGLNQLIVQLMHKNPDERPGSAPLVSKLLSSLDSMDAATQALATVVATTPTRGRLPIPPTSFVGRDQELVEINDVMEDSGCRLLTLLGPGGMGKSRLALETAARKAPEHIHGAWFVPLAPLGSVERIVPAVAKTLEFTFDSHTSDLSPRVQLLDYLSSRSMLLVMDNFEHLIEGSELVNDMLEQASNLNVLITSREKLNLPGEWTYDVREMDFPRNGNGSDIESYGSVRLFLDRARQADARFRMTEDDAPHVAKACRLVGGAPLGIELAAAWVPMLSCQEIVDEIEKSMDFLAANNPNLPEKHRSIRAAFDHSWKLLTESERDAFTRISVFRGGFDREAAEKVAGANLMVLSGLVNKSLLRRNDKKRYEVHELLRQYAQDKLNSGENSAEVNDRHARHYLEVLQSRTKILLGAGMLLARNEIRAETGNLEAAIRWAIEHWDSLEMQKFVLGLAPYYLANSWYEGSETLGEIAELIHEARTRAGLTDVNDDPAYLSTRMHQMWFMANLGSHERCEAICRELMPHIEKLELPREIMLCHYAMGINADMRGEYEESLKRFEVATRYARESDDVLMTGTAILWHGWVAFETGDNETAKKEFEEAHEIWKTHGYQWGLPFSLSKLGTVDDALGNHEQARQYHEAARDAFVHFGDQAGEAYALSRLSQTYYGLGDFEKSRQMGVEGLRLFSDISHRWGMTVCPIRIGFPEIALGNHDAARSQFLEGLKRSIDAEMVPIQLYALSGLAESLAEDEATQEQAARLAGFVVDHPSFPGNYRLHVRKVIAKLETAMGKNAVAGIIAGTKDTDLGDLIQEVLPPAI